MSEVTITTDGDTPAENAGETVDAEVAAGAAQQALQAAETVQAMADVAVANAQIEAAETIQEAAQEATEAKELASWSNERVTALETAVFQMAEQLSSLTILCQSLTEHLTQQPSQAEAPEVTEVITPENQQKENADGHPVAETELAEQPKKPAKRFRLI